MAQNDPSRRTLAPTPQQRRRFREQGRVPHSMIVAPAAALVALPVVALLLAGLMSQAESMVSAGLAFQPTVTGVGSLTPWLAPLVVGPAVVAAGLFVWQGIGMVAPFRLEMLNPMTGLTRLFSRQALTQGGLMVAGLLLLVALAVFGLPAAIPGSGLNLTQGLYLGMAGQVLPVVLAAGGAIGLVLMVVGGMSARSKYERDLKMTPEEFREDLKAGEGDPHIRRRWAQMRRTFYQNRLRESLARADVVLANPTHYAVGLVYEPWRSDAPLVLVKGREHRALRIRELARELGIPVVESPPLARDLFHSVREGEAIPGRLYRAVAEVLAYLYRAHGYRPKPHPKGVTT